MGGSNGGGGSSQDESAKHVLDSIGEEVYKVKVKSEAQTYDSYLKGDLQEAATASGETGGTNETCKLVEQYYGRVNEGGLGKGERYPCKELNGKMGENRFSDTLGGQCTDSKIKGNKNNCGACAPYRRLHLCHHNLESISDYNSTNAKHKLLLEVCMAAKYEGESLTRDYPINQIKYKDFGSTMCTMFARSFADIGDIVRGKDPFYGNPQESAQREQLESKLKDIFAKIHSDVTNDPTKKVEAQKRYKKDKKTGNYYQLREDWWTANRETIWKAMTCDAKAFNYFRHTCNGGSPTKGKCRCDGKNADQVPTYFDYVPQYLRWFEEWAEDFCRKRKHKLENAIKNCRGKDGSGKDKYCDLNRYDCTQTIRGNEHFVEKDDCKGCQYSCAPFVDWIDNQKLEFLKQKQKYDKEIKKADGTNRTSIKIGKTTINNLYVKEFYKKLQEKYGDVENFLQKLNEEQICKNQPYNDESRIDINFKNYTHPDIFSHTEYCQACPWCGAEPKRDGGKGWEAKEEKCSQTKDYKLENITDIPKLTPYISQQSILKKYKTFCANDEKSATPTEKGGEKGKKGDQIVTWQCYYDDTNTNSKENNNCTLGKFETFKQGQKVMSYNAFFWKWVHDMLNDSIQWRDEHSRCINKDNGNTCIRVCNSKCDCFLKWVGQKGKEWKAIKDHFKKQKDIGEQTHCDPGVTLQWVLKEEFLEEKSAQDTQNSLDAEEAKEIKHLRKMLQQAGVVDADGGIDVAALGVCGPGSASATEQNTIMDKLLDEEAKDVTKCQKDCPKPEESRGRSHSPPAGGVHSNTEEDSEEEEEEEEEDDTEESPQAEAEEEVVEQDTTVDGGSTTTTQDTVDVCNTVAKIFEDTGSLKQACSTKYDKYGREKFPNWKCISSGSDTGSTTSSGEKATRGNDATTSSGSICVPPRRRRLYVGKLVEWASRGGDDTVVSGQATENGVSTSTSQTSLLHAFIESAAVETFFLWDRYKKQKEKKPQAPQLPQALQLPNGDSGEDEDKDPQQQLSRGDIPPPFLRQMFYTLGDYRDILVGNTDIVEAAVNSTEDEKKKMKQIQDKIDEILRKTNSENQATSGAPQPPKQQQNSSLTRETLWDKIAEPIWNGMICALTYDTNTASGKTTITQDGTLKEKLLDTNNKPKQNGQQDYTYETVTFEGGFNGDTKLDDFVKRPTYFRWLEEWGDEFCHKQKHKLKIIEKECRGNGKVCSGDGFHCDDESPNKDKIFEDFLCPTCARHCRSYKKWIERKKDEFIKQKEEYSKQKEKCQTQSETAKEFCGTEGKCDTAAKFLEKLGPCKPNNGGSEITFDDSGDTFKHTNLCAPCSKFKVECNGNGKCTSGSGTNHKCHGKTAITKEDIEQMKENIQLVDMYVSDDSTNGVEGDLKDCQYAGIFKGIRKDEWKCGKVCGLDVCTLEKNNNGKGKEHIIVKELLKRWLEYFFEDYNRIQKKLKTCKESGKGSPCIRSCVDKWIKKKTTEWQKINEYYIDQYTKLNHDGNNLTSFLETLIPRMDLVNDKGKINDLSTYLRSYACKCNDNSEKKGDGKDTVDCLLSKLQEKAKTCADQDSGEKQTCDSLPLGDEDDTLDEETEENQVKAPKICGDMKTQPEQQEDEGECKAAAAPKEPTAPKDTEAGSGKGTEEHPSPPPAPDPEAPTSLPPADQPFDSTILQTTIPFGVALALGSIAFLFLKVKVNIYVWGICLRVGVF